ncbi:MAG TPA: 6-phosphogluconolactonase [Ardenticatenaceae bacterium]|nr:6-phosphogluconolactonase [Ardenticatenaceae bacterium]
MSRPGVEIFPTVDGVGTAAAERIAAIATEAVAARGEWSIALSGGETPKALYTLLATPTWRLQVPWSQASVFWGDERCVGPEHAESNYRAARTTLLASVPVAPERVYRIEGERPPEEAAERYSQILARACTLGPGERPRFDVILLGLGADAHTASLFPESGALDHGERLVVANQAPALNPPRVTLTAPTLNNGAHVLFLVTGASKAGAVAAVIEGERRPRQLPAQLIVPASGTLVWLLDEAAAARLERRR